MPPSPKITPSAAELTGSVSSIPMTTETTIPMRRGCCSVAHMMILPSAVIREEHGGPTIRPTADPAVIVPTGVSIISRPVRPEISMPISMAAKEARKAPRGSPAPAKTTAPSERRVPAIILLAYAPTVPATAAETVTSTEAP